VIEAARTQPETWAVQGYVAPAPAGADPGAPYLGDDDALTDRLSAIAPERRPWLILGFGADQVARAETVRRLAGHGARWGTVVHRAAWVSPTAELAEGAVVLAGAVVNAGARIGPHAIVNSAAVIEHDVTIGQGTHVAPAAAVGGATTVGASVFIGLGARIRDHIRVGDGAVVGMGAVVVEDVLPGTRVLGVPARPDGPDDARDPAR
jgi:acetyltransferase EpsM